MKIANVKSILDASMKAGQKPVLMVGNHGIGKSEIVKEWCEENGYHFEVLFASQTDVGDLVGIPFRKEVDGGRTVTYHAEPVLFDRIHAAAKKGIQSVLFLDEFSRGQLDVRQSMFQLVLDGRIHEIKLPVVNGVKTMIIAADNPTDSGYNVESLDPALINRFLRVDVELDTEDWLKYAEKTNTNTVVRNFIAANPTKLHFVPDDDAEASATPRSWSALAKFVDNFPSTPKDFWYTIASGLVGKAVGAQFISYYENYKHVIKIEDIVELAEQVFEETGSIRQAGDAVKKLTKEAESTQKMDFVNQLVELQLKDGAKKSDVVGLFGMLYSLEIETLASVMHEQKAADVKRYIELHKLDQEFNNGEKAIVKLIRSNAGAYENAEA